jgi:hypothetical protein
MHMPFPRATRYAFAAAIGLVIGVSAIAVAIFIAAAGHGSYVPAIIFFPLTMLSTRWTDVITVPAMILAVVQYPAYGMALARGKEAGTRARLAFAIAAAHGFLACAAFAFLQGGSFS